MSERPFLIPGVCSLLSCGVLYSPRWIPHSLTWVSYVQSPTSAHRSDKDVQNALYTKIGLKPHRLIQHTVAIKTATWNTATNASRTTEDAVRVLAPSRRGAGSGDWFGMPGDEAPLHVVQPAVSVGGARAVDVEVAPLPTNDTSASITAWVRLANDSEQDATDDGLSVLRARLVAGLRPERRFLSLTT